MILPDISEYYRGDLVQKEEDEWLRTKMYERNASVLLELIEREKLTNVFEAGCATGNIAMMLPSDIWYVGIDLNEDFLGMAKKKDRGEVGCKMFFKMDIRGQRAQCFDLSCAFAFFKHFGLHEWDQIVKTVLELGTWSVFDVQTADCDFDNGTEFHHVYVTPERLRKAIESAGHVLVEKMVTWVGGVGGSGVIDGSGVDARPAQELLLTTRKKTEQKQLSGLTVDIKKR